MRKPPLVSPDDGTVDTARWYASEGARLGATMLAELHQTERIRVRMAKTATKDRDAILFVEVPADVKQALAALARENERTLSGELRTALCRHLVGDRTISELVDAS
jgi:hypothetical protein